MDVTFSTAKLQKLCNSLSKLRSEYGDRMASVIQRRLADLHAAENLEVMKLLPGRCHALTANLAGHLALDLVHPKRLVFQPNHIPRPVTAAGNLDWGNVVKIEIVAIGDYH